MLTILLFLNAIADSQIFDDNVVSSGADVILQILNADLSEISQDMLF